MKHLLLIGALATSAHVVQGEITTAFVEHAYIEPEAGWALRVGDRIEIHATTQTPYMDRDEIANLMRLKPEAVRIVPTACGGGFGGTGGSGGAGGKGGAGGTATGAGSAGGEGGWAQIKAGNYQGLSGGMASGTTTGGKGEDSEHASGNLRGARAGGEGERVPHERESVPALGKGEERV
mgnify:CR=1 FL=1